MDMLLIATISVNYVLFFYLTASTALVTLVVIIANLDLSLKMDCVKHADRPFLIVPFVLTTYLVHHVFWDILSVLLLKVVLTVQLVSKTVKFVLHQPLVNCVLIHL